MFQRALDSEDMTSEEIERFARAEYERQVSVERLNLSGEINAALADQISNLAWELEHGPEAASMPDGEVVEPRNPMIEEIEAKTGVTLSGEKREELRTALLRSQIFALDNILRRRRGEDDAPVGLLNPAVQSTNVRPVTTTPVYPLSEAVSGYLAAKSGDWISKTYGQVETSLRLFCDHVGDDKDLSEVTRLDLTNWRERMRRLRPRWASSAASKGLPLDELLAIHGQGPETLSDKTLARHLSAVHGLFTWAIDTGYFDGTNPVKVSGGKSSPRYKRGTFTDSEVAAIFAGWQFETRPRPHSHNNALPWIALLGAFTGARLEDICSLHVDDVREESGIHYLDIKASKTPAGVRRVPVHSQVIALGFLDYANACRGYLFPSLGKPDRNGRRGVYIGKMFTRHCRAVGIDKPLLGFHYWRTTVLTKLENAGVPELDAARLTGHKIKTMSYGVYSGGPDLARLAAVVERIEYKELSL
jgi:integrase